MTEEIDEEKMIEEYIILLLGVLDEKPIPSKEHFQKEFFILTKVDPKISELIKFEKHYEGPYDQELDDIIENPLYYTNAIQIRKKGNTKNYSLTADGKNIFKEIVEKKSDNINFKKLLSSMKMIREIYEKLNVEELLFLIYVTFPEFTQKSKISEKLLVPEKKKELADSLLKKKVITSKRYWELLKDASHNS